jgi:hypothetical protein
MIMGVYLFVIYLKTVNILDYTSRTMGWLIDGESERSDRGLI